MFCCSRFSVAFSVLLRCDENVNCKVATFAAYFMRYNRVGCDCCNDKSIISSIIRCFFLHRIVSPFFFITFVNFQVSGCYPSSWLMQPSQKSTLWILNFFIALGIDTHTYFEAAKFCWNTQNELSFVTSDVPKKQSKITTGSSSWKQNGEQTLFTLSLATTKSFS